MLAFAGIKVKVNNGSDNEYKYLLL